MFDDRGREVAIVAEDISMARLDAITNSASGIEKTQNFLIHKSGKYITNKDSKKIMGALDTLQETTKQVRSGSDRIQEESGSIQGTVDSLKNISKEVNTSVLDVEQASQGIAASLEIARKIAEGKYLVPPEIAACG
jgi:methyl-accepting chemotaxis protein